MDDYPLRIGQLRRAGGVAQTAWCTIAPNEFLADQTYPLEEARSLADAIVDALSLATGTLVSWHFCVGEAWPDKMQYFHRAAVSKTFSSLVVSRGWYASAADTVRAWLEYGPAATVPRDDLRTYVRQHCDSCIEETFFETRGLSAATLLDVIAGSYAERTGIDTFVAADTWQSAVLPALQDALDASSDLAPEQRIEATQSLAHLYRRSFKRKLRALLHDLNIAVNPSTLTRAINSRNALTHAGHFHSKNKEKHIDEYLRLVLLARCILVSAAGVKNNLHDLLAD